MAKVKGYYSMCMVRIGIDKKAQMCLTIVRISSPTYGIH